jgi:transposase
MCYYLFIIIGGFAVMMGKQKGVQENLFSYNVSLDARVRKDHVLRKIQQAVDFGFIYKEVEQFYGERGNVSVPPVIILKMMFLLFFYDVRSERELMDTIPERIDWIWFLGYTLEDEIPDHSVLSKARSRWGVDVFRSFFERIVWQCVEKGLVSGEKLFIDASLIKADASRNSVVDRNDINRYLNKRYMELEDRLEDKDTQVNKTRVSTTDPEASIVRRNGKGPDLCYKTHRGVDPLNEVITSTLLTTGNVDDGAVLFDMVEIHERNTEAEVKTVVADSRYGITNNYLMCHDLNIEAHIPSLEETQKGRNNEIISSDEFTYDKDKDTYICPSGQILDKKRYHKKRDSFDYYTLPRVCKACPLKENCTRSKTSRSVKRHLRQEELDIMRDKSRSRQSKQDIKKRQDLSERSFAQSTRYGFKQARWRGLIRVTIQDYLIASIQNIIKLIKIKPKRKITGVMSVMTARPGANIPGVSMFFRFIGGLLQNTKNINPSFCCA